MTVLRAAVATLVAAGVLGVVPAGADEAPAPADRYAVAGGCYSVFDARNGVAWSPDGEATPVRFQAIDLGRYLLRTPSGGAVHAQGRNVRVARGPVPSAEVDLLDDGGAFRLRFVEAQSYLDPAARRVATDGPPLALVPATGCWAPPEVELGVTGPVATGASPDAEVRGFLDAHLHIMAFEFLGGSVHCGRPWHPYGVEHALVDCPDHELGSGAAAVLENFFARDLPVGTHDTVGWPTFRDWPAHGSLTHEQVYFRWLERAWRGGLRLVVNLHVDNRVLCTSYPMKRNRCDEMAGVRLQVQRLRELERYIDSQHGGPGRGWFRIVDDPAEARHVVNEGRLAVVQGIEVSEPFDCRISLGRPTCTEEDIDRQLDELEALGIRQLLPIHKLDNALGGTTGDSGPLGTVINLGNFMGTGAFWDLRSCAELGLDEHDHDPLAVEAPPAGPRRQVLAELLPLPVGAALPVYPPGPHCNARGLTPLGQHAVEAMMDRGLLVDIDHMGVLTRDGALDLIEAAGYPGVISSHGWATPDAYQRVLDAGGVVAPYAGGSAGFVEAWRDLRARAGADPDRPFPIGYGADANGLGDQGAPRHGEVGVTYPFTGFGGTTMHRQRSGSRVFDVNVDGVAHYGLYPDWIEDLRVQAGDQIVADLELGPEAYLQTWQRAMDHATRRGRAGVVAPPPDHVELARGLSFAFRRLL